MEKRCSGREFVAARDAKRRFGFVRTAIADSAIAVRLAARKLDAGSAELPTAVTSGRSGPRTPFPRSAGFGPFSETATTPAERVLIVLTSACHVCSARRRETRETVRGLANATLTDTNAQLRHPWATAARKR